MFPTLQNGDSSSLGFFWFATRYTDDIPPPLYAALSPIHQHRVLRAFAYITLTVLILDVYTGLLTLVTASGWNYVTMFSLGNKSDVIKGVYWSPK